MTTGDRGVLTEAELEAEVEEFARLVAAIRSAQGTLERMIEVLETRVQRLRNSLIPPPPKEDKP